jgi:tetratricopeptide (TPR) repeat protein
MIPIEEHDMDRIRLIMTARARRIARCAVFSLAVLVSPCAASPAPADDEARDVEEAQEASPADLAKIDEVEALTRMLLGAKEEIAQLQRELKSTRNDCESLEHKLVDTIDYLFKSVNGSVSDSGAKEPSHYTRYAKNLARLNQRNSSDSRASVVAAHAIGNAYSNTFKDHETAEVFLRIAYDYRLEHWGEFDLQTQQARLDLARALGNQGKYEEAVSHLNVIVTHRMDSAGTFAWRRDVAPYVELLATHLCRLGRFEEAEPWLRLHVGLEKPPGESRARRNQYGIVRWYAPALAALGRYDDAVSVLYSEHRQDKKEYELAEPVSIDTLILLAEANDKAERKARSSTDFFALAEKLLKFNDDIGRSVASPAVARLHTRLGDLEAAEAVLLRCLEQAGAPNVVDPLRANDIRRVLVTFYEEHGAPEKAEPHRARILEPVPMEAPR